MSSIPRPGSRHETELPVGPDTGRQPETSPDGRPLAAEVRGLVKTYGGLTAVAGIDFEIRRGEIFALLGPNGAGKTTTVEILEGYRARDGGQVTVLDCDPGRERAQLKNRIGIMLPSTWPRLPAPCSSGRVGGLTSASGRRRRPVPPRSAPTRGTGCSEPDSAPSWPYVEGATGSRQLMRGATCERGPRTH